MTDRLSLSFACVLLRQFPTLHVSQDTRLHFAHVNSTKRALGVDHRLCKPETPSRKLTGRQILIRDHVAEIDFSTPREETTELVSRKTLQQRHPDMIWSGGRVVLAIRWTT